jgi:hypothetical protein
VCTAEALLHGNYSKTDHKIKITPEYFLKRGQLLG